MQEIEVKLSDIVFREDIYPRIEHSQKLAQEYAENISLLPAIEINQKNELIDGRHRQIAHQLAAQKVIKAFVTETKDDTDLLRLAIQRNSAHGFQLSMPDKRKLALRFYNDAAQEFRGHVEKELPGLLSVAPRTVAAWLSDIKSETLRERNSAILQLHLQCRTQEEIGEAVGMTQQAVDKVLQQIANLQKVVNPSELDPKLGVTDEMLELSQFTDPDFRPPIYNVWSFGKSTNDVSHFGNTEQRIVDNLIWLYTEPFDVVLDPFGGGGSTLDVCVKRMRRCWIADRQPKPGMEKRLRKHDICKSLPQLPWKDVSLVYLDPPYWRQAQFEYSKDAEDMANMPLDVFTSELSGVVNRIADKLKAGSVVSLIIQPTQWRSEPKGKFTDHMFDVAKLVKTKNLEVENRISCPYSTEQCTPQMVEWAKENRKPLVISREMTVWRKL